MKASNSYDRIHNKSVREQENLITADEIKFILQSAIHVQYVQDKYNNDTFFKEA